MAWLGCLLIVTGTLILVGCLSQRNFELINNPCPVCECEPNVIESCESVEEARMFH